MIKKIIAAVAVLAFGAVGFFCGFYYHDYFVDPEYVSLKFIIENYKKYYLEEQENYIEIMGDSLLDSYSDYYTAEDYAIIQKTAQGVRAGIGITFSGYQTEYYIYNVLGNSPAEKAGVKSGGLIKGIKEDSDSAFLDLTYDAFVKKMESIPVGKQFELRVDYDGEVKTFSLAKSEYNETYVFYTDKDGSFRFSDQDGELKFVSYQYDLGVDLPEDTAYIKYTSFNGLSGDLYGSANQFKVALQKFKENGRKKLIIDLRNNGGGFMNIMCEIASHLVCAQDGSKVLISKAIYKDGKEDKFNSPRTDYYDYGFEKIVFLANSGTASASEALIGACLDYDGLRNIVRVVLSRSSDGKYKTYGKGIMQTTIENRISGEAIKLTTAKIYWPTSDTCIHGVGITKSLTAFSDKIIEAQYMENVDYELIAALSI